MKTFFRWISATVFLAMALSMSTFADFTSNKKSINSEIVDSKEEQIRTIFDTTSIDPLFNSTLGKARTELNIQILKEIFRLIYLMEK